MKKQSIKLSVIIPTYNEKENIGPLLERLCYGPDAENIQVIIVDSAATSDDTLTNCNKYSVTKINLNILAAPYNCMKEQKMRLVKYYILCMRTLFLPQFFCP